MNNIETQNRKQEKNLFIKTIGYSSLAVSIVFLGYSIGKGDIGSTAIAIGGIVGSLNALNLTH